MRILRRQSVALVNRSTRGVCKGEGDFLHKSKRSAYSDECQTKSFSVCLTNVATF